MTIEKIHEIFLQCNSVCTDTRKIHKNDLFFALKGENFNGNSYAEKALRNGAKFAIIDEESFSHIPNTILVKDALKALQELATYHRNYLNIPIVALTGSNGKTTTKELINTTLSQKYNTKATIGNLNNHIGVPLTLLSMNESTEMGIVEMGANHQKEIEFLCNIAKPDYGYITNFGKAHLEGFGGVEGVIKGKSEMYDFLINNNKTIFVNGNDPIQVDKTSHSNRYIFGDNINADCKITFIDAQPTVKVKYNNTTIQSNLIGEYNFSNIAAAITIANYFKVEEASIKNAIESYIPTNNRSQVIKKNSNEIILDAYNANPTSMRAAILNFEKLKDNNKIAFLGDMFELGKEAELEHQSIADLIESTSINQTILIGENFNKTQTKNSLKFKTFEDFEKNFNMTSVVNSTLLIKGSRGMAMERILDLL
ncbi:UDP-N-acetylmuramoyl-tripeptide--D-alanyl-D-alanine ligase [Siansivirga zeaxanthinifaciens]|uniref:UDP-N-acetylmuramoyl-tripeptide--D-alanyl-D-alanine ligase n=1 Tax=Siansivirga zeaxanthinifaciens CC-SAMT-1 TaxID=1454006 RepID=A0A0C5W5U8_9FLAO|nr:UDP-N-acetylmuramoyl-tripeptide--D-alanyl-D-alanine ligase [Siansivirga zeaxanthinifaciens]AJR02518.1 UDP-N-acetylmuramoyl-tripeptide--D-alanyl-D-alanine ligase [Siansivirga zeaxanthinifaciens CC-SAMT-1]